MIIMITLSLHIYNVSKLLASLSDLKLLTTELESAIIEIQTTSIE